MIKGVKLSILLFLSLLINLNVLAQSNSNINSLKKGVLIVRLDMQKNKINAYEKSLATKKLSEKDEKRMRKNLEALINERKIYMENVINSFKELYTFSQIAFIENHEFKKFIDGENVDIIGNQETKALIATRENLFYLIKGRHDAEWIIVNKEFKRPAHPFPNAFGIGLKKFVDLFTGEKNYSAKNQTKIARKIEKSLTKFYNRSLKN